MVEWAQTGKGMRGMYGSAGGTVMALLLFALFQFCGTACAWFLFSREGKGVRLLLGSVLGSVMLQWFPALFAFPFGFTKAAHLWAVGIACALAGLCIGFSLRKRWTALRERGLQKRQEGLFRVFLRRKFLWFLLLVLTFYWFLVWKSFLLKNGCVYCTQATYGDMNMHLSFLTSLARQGTFPPDYSILPGTKLSYPFLSDSISSSLLLCGASLKLSYMLPMCAAGAQVMFGFYLFALRITEGDGKKAGLAWLFFFFNGGLGFVYFLGGGKENFTRLFTEFYQTPTNLTEHGIRWVNVIVDMMLPQRATLFGWAVLFPLLFLLYRAVFQRENRYFLYAGILAGLLPMIHTHSFLTFALVCGVWLVFSLLNGLGMDRRAVQVGKWCTGLGVLIMCGLKGLLTALNLRASAGLLWAAGGLLLLCTAFAAVLLWLACRKGAGKGLAATWGLLFLSACVLALPQLFYWTFRQAGSGGFVQGHFGWDMGEEGYVAFYLKNIGLTAVLAFAGLLAARRRDFMKYAPALVIWVFAELVIFQPNPYDNNKLLYPAFGFLCCAASEFALRVWKRWRFRLLRNIAAACLVFLCSVSALLSMGREAVSEYELYGSGALRLCTYVEEHLPPDAVVLTDIRHNNEIASLTGRNVVCGSPAYLFYHGLNYWENEAAVKTMYENPEASQSLFERFRVQYVLISDFERRSYQVDTADFRRLFPCIYNDGSRMLYQVTDMEGPDEKTEGRSGTGHKKP